MLKFYQTALFLGVGMPPATFYDKYVSEAILMWRPIVAALAAVELQHNLLRKQPKAYQASSAWPVLLGKLFSKCSGGEEQSENYRDNKCMSRQILLSVVNEQESREHSLMTQSASFPLCCGLHAVYAFGYLPLCCHMQSWLVSRA